MPRSKRSGSTRLLTLLVAGLLCCSLLGGAGAVTASSSNVYVTVSDIAVSDDEPTTDDAITVTPTIRHSSGHDGGFQVTQVVLEAPDRGKVDEADDLGSIASGETIDVPLQTTFDTAGEKRLIVKVRGIKEDADGNTEQVGVIERPVYVSVSEPSSDSTTDPRLRIDADRAVAGTEVPVTVTVSNGDDEALTDLVAHLDSEGAVEEPTRIHPTLEGGNMTTFDFRFRADEPGPDRLEAALEYDDGNRVEAVQPIRVEPLREDVDLYASVLERNESTVLQYRVTNRGNAPIDDVSISGQTDSEQLPGATIETVDAASAETVSIPIDEALTGTAEIEAAYTIDDRRNRSTRTIEITGATATESDIASIGGQSIIAAGASGAGSVFGAVIVLLGLGGISFLGYRQWNR
ncbi:hypothetical protein [Natrinema pallidum]|uniref:Transglutaminase domain-containing protein n=2 Tax=Natrinema pallidum TaxID=69527 RepID=L9Z7N5_9EURY|nr:hypothetical protein [Natrinema pallidum]ELY81193.1 Transglutaminase domain-containing protein [Natrinema pallidum DSM 3751]QCW02607.1 transglutaminase [Natrinema pallidum]